MRILFVCHGNVNRSAAAEIICSKIYPSLEVKSAGLKTKGGIITAKKTRDLLNLKGYDTQGIRSTPISKELVGWADIVFYMDNPNHSRLINEFGDSAKFKRLGLYAGVEKIPDPGFSKGTKVHELAIFLIEKSLANWTKEAHD